MTQASTRSSRIDIWLCGIILLAAVLRMGWVLHLPADDASLLKLPDQQEYLELGRNWLWNHELSFVDPRFGDVVYAFRTPGYPALVALCRGNVRIIRILQAIIDSSNVLAIYLLARRWLTRWRSRFAAAIIAVNPFLIYFCGLILSETLFTTMLAWGMTLLVLRRCATGKNACPTDWAIGWWAGAIVLAASVLVRPSALVLPLGLGIVSAFVNRSSRQPYDWRWLPPVGTLILLLILAALLPWAWRNQRVLGRWIWTSTNGGITLYDGFNPDATGASNQSFVRDMPQLRSMDEAGRDRYLRELAWQYIREHPQRDAELTLMKIGRTWSPVPLSAEYGTDRRLVAIALAYMVPLYALVVLGLWLGAIPRAAKLYLLLPAVYFTIVHALSVGSLRYRIPADLPMAVIAASAQWSAVSRNRSSDLIRDAGD